MTDPDAPHDDEESLEAALARSSDATERAFADPEFRARFFARLAELESRTPTPTMTGDEFLAKAGFAPNGTPYARSVTEAGKSPLRELVEAHRDEIKAIVERHHGRSVAIFGSVAREEDGPDSDIDFLVELAPNTRPFAILALGAELEDALGVKVDVGTPDSLRERLRGEVLAEAVSL